MKRIFDFIVAFLLLVILSPLFLIVSVWILLDSRGGVFYCSRRVGQFEREMTLYKFRTMVPNDDPDGITVGEDDPRITAAGRILRRYKLDELPQLWNVVKGDMSLVGPRPDIPGYNEYYKKQNPDHYQMKPGLTSPASIFFMRESERYVSLDDPFDTYVRKTIPQKVNLDSRLIQHTLIDDLRVIGQTFRGMIQKNHS
jgi:lipopolysaccharide/colanic/teichoic acid biosynthesis glycosyltransferase